MLLLEKLMHRGPLQLCWGNIVNWVCRCRNRVGSGCGGGDRLRVVCCAGRGFVDWGTAADYNSFAEFASLVSASGRLNYSGRASIPTGPILTKPGPGVFERRGSGRRGWTRRRRVRRRRVRIDARVVYAGWAMRPRSKKLCNFWIDRRGFIFLL